MHIDLVRIAVHEPAHREVGGGLHSVPRYAKGIEFGVYRNGGTLLFGVYRDGGGVNRSRNGRGVNRSRNRGGGVRY